MDAIANEINLVNQQMEEQDKKLEPKQHKIKKKQYIIALLNFASAP